MTRRLPSLGDYDNSDDATPQARQARRRADNREPSTRGERHAPLGAGDCWCGEPFGHPWPGKADGAPYPSDRLELLSPPPERGQ